MSDLDRLRVPPESLTWRPPAEFAARDLAEFEPAARTVGQDRAVEALRLGLALRAPGYNVYVAGPAGTGRTSTVRSLVSELRPDHAPSRKDRAYVHNFADPSSPRLLVFAAGQARAFEGAMRDLLRELSAHIPALFEESSFRAQRDALRARLQEAQQRAAAEFDRRLRERGFALVNLQMGGVTIAEVVPLHAGEPVTWSAAEELVEGGKLEAAAFRRLKQDSDGLRQEMEAVFLEMNAKSRALAFELKELERGTARKLLDTLVGDLKRRFEPPAVQAYLDQVAASVLGELELFKKPGGTGAAEALAALAARAGAEAEDRLAKYQVNVLLDNTAREGTPVVVEDLPSYANLFGTIEVEMLSKGTFRTDFMRIRPGSLLRADGGFLILQAKDLLLAYGVWPAFKRALLTGRLEIRPPETPLLGGTVAIKPEPIEIEVKVVLIGDLYLYNLLYLWEEEFRKIFKVKAEFDDSMPLAKETFEHFARVLSRISREEDLLPLDASGLGAVARAAVRKAGKKTKISTRFSELADVVREAGFRARREGAKAVGARQVESALKEIDRRHALLDEKLQEAIEEGTLRIATRGTAIGQVNGLSVYDLGMYAFGKPVRITATVSLGRAGIVSVEREAGLSGRIHDKGVLILGGYLRQRYAQDIPLSLAASLVFEQSYGGVEGDSASSAEVYALLSALAEAPLSQELAVTGSVDQAGRIQAIGGVNEKIEGFYKVCARRGLTGHQGVLIPADNVRDLVLDEEEVEAVRKGSFHVFSVETVDQGLELLTGRRAAEIHERARARLAGYAETLARFEREQG